MKTWNTKSGYTITKVLSGRSNVFLLSNGNVKVMVDTGPARNWKRLRKNLEKLGVGKIDLLLLTHTHFDHAGNAGRVRDHFGAHVAVHLEEKYQLENGINILPRGTVFFTKMLIHHFGDILSGRFNFDPCKTDIAIDSTRPLNELGFNTYILPTPGHSPGSMSLIVDEEIAIVGDAMFGIFRNSIFPPFGDDTATMIESWKKLLDTGCKTFLPAHGFENSREKVLKNYLRRV